METTFLIKTKEDKKDTIDIEIGDSKQPDFKPQFKFMRWDNEVNFSMRAEEKEGATNTIENGILKYITDEYEVHQYDKPEASLEGGFEFEWVFHKKPKSNVLTATVQSKQLDFFYQKPLTEELEYYKIRYNNPNLTATETHIYNEQGEILVQRKEEIVGGYVVYHKEKSGNFSNKNYKAGKAFEIHRPVAKDADGTTRKCDLTIVDGVLTVTVPQKFIDEATYPIVVDPTFGYSTIGASSAGGFWNTNMAFGSKLNAVASVSGTISGVSWYTNASTGTGENNFKGLATEFVSSTAANILTNGVGNIATVTFGSSDQWLESTFSTPPSVTSGVSYYGLAVHSSGAGSFNNRTFYDSGVSGDSWYETDNNYATPTNPSGMANDSIKYSMYATYTGSSAPAIKSNFLMFM